MDGAASIISEQIPTRKVVLEEALLGYPYVHRLLAVLHRPEGGGGRQVEGHRGSGVSVH